MIIGKPSDIRSSEITPRSVYLRRREFIGKSLIASAGVSLSAVTVASEQLKSLDYRKADFKNKEGFYTNEALAPYKDIKRFNNFYEFGSDKGDPEKHAQNLTVDPWSLTVEGEVEKPGVYHLEDILKPVNIEERIYRLRCVEAWSMVIPWQGFPLADLIERFQPSSKAKYIQFETLHRPEEMPGQRARTSTIDWPYVEGLRMDEAMNPLSLIAVGLYGKELPKQNGAPLRLVIPWKYGFKSIKSIVKIRFLEKMPMTTWVSLAASEYGFYANVNPQVNHPRWSQGSERRLPSNFFSPNRIPTKPFNGYAEQVSHLYAGMDLKKYY